MSWHLMVLEQQMVQYCIQKCTFYTQYIPYTVSLESEDFEKLSGPDYIIKND